MAHAPVFLLAHSALAAAVPGTPWFSFQATPAPTPEERAAAQVVALTNDERRKEGLPVLRVQENLTKAAAFLALDLSNRRVLAHKDKAGRGVAERYQAEGYLNWTAVAENVAYGQKTPEQVVAAWMKSPGHRANILDPDLREIGVGVRTASNGQIYWVQAFGTR